MIQRDFNLLISCYRCNNFFVLNKFKTEHITILSCMRQDIQRSLYAQSIMFTSTRDNRFNEPLLRYKHMPYIEILMAERCLITHMMPRFAINYCRVNTVKCVAYNYTRHARSAKYESYYAVWDTHTKSRNTRTVGIQ